ncbi:BON domain-containing protein [bacterium]|nr:BON domain-containing protein [bacterium]
MLIRLLRFASTLSLLALAALLGGCPDSPEADKKVQEMAKVPGLDEAVLAKDRAIGITILASWESDVELVQEQLAVEEVHAGKVRITGIVSRPELKERAERIAKGTEGVLDVVSTITVDEKLKEKRINMDDF